MTSEIWQGAYPLPELEDYEAIRTKLRAEWSKDYPTIPEELTFKQKDQLVGWYLATHSTLKWGELVDAHLRKLKWEFEDRLQRISVWCWAKTRRLVWERDGGICHMCGLEIPIEYYDCGHIIDRVMGGPDRESNLVVMCNVCNHYRKPPTSTREEYLEHLATDLVLNNVVKKLNGRELIRGVVDVIV